MSPDEIRRSWDDDDTPRSVFPEPLAERLTRENKQLRAENERVAATALTVDRELMEARAEVERLREANHDGADCDDVDEELAEAKGWIDFTGKRNVELHARAEAAESENKELRAEVERWKDKANEAGTAYATANSKHHEELDRANRLERMADTLAGKAVDLEDRARAAEARLDALVADLDRLVDDLAEFATISSGIAIGWRDGVRISEHRVRAVLDKHAGGSHD